MEIRNLSQEEEQKLCRLRDMIVLALSEMEFYQQKKSYVSKL